MTRIAAFCGWLCVFRRVVTFVLIVVAAVRPAAHAQTYMFGRADVPAGNAPTAIATGDFNGDGLVDLVVASSGDNTISVLLGAPSGVFAPPVAYATGLDPVAIVTGDFNRDGNLDVAVTNAFCTLTIGATSQVSCTRGTVSIFLGNGDGTFLGHVDYGVGTGSSSIVATDFNGDGKLDLAVTNVSDSTVSVLLGNGDGTFQNQVIYAVAAGTLQSAVVGDFNGDGKADLAINGSSVVSVLLGNGDGTFQSHIDSGVGGYSIVAGDFNQDGKLDVVVTGLSGGTGPLADNNTAVLLGNGDGTFSLGALYFGGVSITAGDLNGDGKPDLVVSQVQSASVTVMLGNGDGTFRGSEAYGTGYDPTSVVLADLNGDGRVDLAVVDSDCPVPLEPCSEPTAPAPGAISILLGFGDGTFVRDTEYAVSSGPVGNGPVSITSSDFNNDGNLDLATANPQNDSISVLLAKGDGTFQPQVIYPVDHLPVSVASGDFKNNGTFDLVTANEICTNTPCNPGTVSVLLGNGDATFQPHVEYSVGLLPTDVAVADFRNVGKLDLAVVNSGSATVSILLGNGDGTFQPEVSYGTDLNPQQIAVGDFNRDGKLDLAVVARDSASILLGNGDGTFQPPVHTGLSGGSAITAADFNGDGKLDLAIGYGFPKTGLFVYLGNGDGTFGVPAFYQIDGGHLAVTDLNQDGKLDLVASQSVGLVLILLGNGDGTFQQPMPYLLSGVEPEGIALVDFNRDGAVDLAVADAFENSVGIMLSLAFKSISPGSLDFGSQGVGTISRSQAITIRNSSNVKLDIAGISSSGIFAETDICGASLSPGATCSVSVTFSPTTIGLQSGAITVTDSTRISPLAIAVKGSGVSGSFLTTYPLRQNFSPQVVGTTSSPSTVMLANTGNAPLSLNGVSITGANSADFSEISNCGNSLSMGSSCAVNVTFKPTASGSRIAGLSISDTAPGSPQSTILEGTGLLPPDFTVAGSPPSQTVSAGRNAIFSLVIAPSGSFSGTVNLSCVITPVVTPAPTCSLSHSSVQISGGGSQPVIVTVGTTAPMRSGTVSYLNLPPGSMPLVWMLTLLASGWLLSRRRKRLPALPLPIMVMALASCVSCGGSGSPTTSHGTPAGTYAVAIAASSGSLSHMTTVQLIVQ